MSNASAKILAGKSSWISALLENLQPSSTEIKQRSFGDNAIRIETQQSVVALFDMVDADRLSDARKMINALQVSVDFRVVDNPFQVALEHPVVSGVEPDQGNEQADISFADLITDDVSLIGQALLDFIKCEKNIIDGRFIFLL